MPENNQYVVLEITTSVIADIVKTIKPEVKDWDYETELKDQFLVFGLPRPGESSLVKPGIFHRSFSPMESEGVLLHRFEKIEKIDDPTRKTFVRGRT